MNQLNDLYQKLEQYKNFDENDNDQKFLEIVDKIVAFYYVLNCHEIWICPSFN